jgi:integrase
VVHCRFRWETRTRADGADADVGEGRDRRMDFGFGRCRRSCFPASESQWPRHRQRLGEKVVWQMLKKYAAEVGVPGIAPHDLRRTCAKLCRAAGGELEQIQMLLGHASVQTTERYLGTRQDLVHAPNDAIKLKVVV